MYMECAGRQWVLFKCGWPQPLAGCLPMLGMWLYATSCEKTLVQRGNASRSWTQRIVCLFGSILLQPWQKAPPITCCFLFLGSQQGASGGMGCTSYIARGCAATSVVPFFITFLIMKVRGSKRCLHQIDFLWYFKKFRRSTRGTAPPQGSPT